MALVAYGSSGESSDSEDESPPSQQQQLLTAKSVISNGAAGGGSGTSNAASTISGSISKVEHKADRKKTRDGLKVFSLYLIDYEWTRKKLGFFYQNFFTNRF